MRDRGDVLVSYDPNVRPGLLGRPRARPSGSWSAASRLAHVAKASAEDISWLYPGQDAEDVARHWHRLGVTPRRDHRRGERRDRVHRHRAAAAPPGARGAGGGHRRRRGLVHLRAAGRAGPAGQCTRHPRWPTARPRNCGPVLDDAITVSAITCERAGANPPTLADLASTGWGTATRVPGSAGRPGASAAAARPAACVSSRRGWRSGTPNPAPPSGHFPVPRRGRPARRPDARSRR